MQTGGKLDMPCPFCGGHVQDVEDGDDVGLVHSEPMCETFERLDVLDFLSACRERQSN